MDNKTRVTAEPKSDLTNHNSKAPIHSEEHAYIANLYMGSNFLSFLISQIKRAEIKLKFNAHVLTLKKVLKNLTLVHKLWRPCMKRSLKLQLCKEVASRLGYINIQQDKRKSENLINPSFPLRFSP